MPVQHLQRDAPEAGPSREPLPRAPAPGIASPTAPEIPRTDEPAAPGLRDLDRIMRATVAGLTGGRSPVSLFLASIDWASHLALAPTLQQHLAVLAAERSAELFRYALTCAIEDAAEPTPCVSSLPQDRRFADPAWSRWPFNVIHQAFLMQEHWWEQATANVPGVTRHNMQAVSFMARQVLDLCAPSNFPATNPVVLRRTFESGGRNLRDGLGHLAEDIRRFVTHEPPAGAEAFKVGETVACTPGAVIFRNELIELIQYTPTTEAVHPEPILIVPAWIMKYYILDLSPENSLVRYLVQRGHTVFMISWRNPRPEHRDLGMDDYLSLGIDAAIATVKEVVPGQPIHGVGYCLGGTLLAMAAAALGRRNDETLKTLTLLAAQTDFADAGELTLFIDESEVTFLEDMMWKKGLLEARQMAGAFRLLRSNDLIWSRLVRDYLLGERAAVSDLMAWSGDATRMPYRMHSEYLRRLFLNNDLAAGRYVVDGAPISISSIQVPMFVVGTEWDHIAPWQSVYKIHLQADVDITFALTSGGHNAGIVNPPGSLKRQYRVGYHPHGTPYISPESWRERNRPTPGSWWTAWADWLKQKSSAPVAPPPLGLAHSGTLAPAPGRYVLDQ